LKLQNAWGLYDVKGNLWEWCFDYYGAYSADNAVDPTGPITGEYRVVRGNDYSIETIYPDHCSLTNRGIGNPDSGHKHIGMRMVLEYDEPLLNPTPTLTNVIPTSTQTPSPTIKILENTPTPYNSATRVYPELINQFSHGESNYIKIMLDDVDLIQNYGFDLVFDYASLEYESISAKNTLNQSFEEIEAVLVTPGRINIQAKAGNAQPITEEGILLWIQIKAFSGTGGESDIILENPTADIKN